ncbi:WD repeat and HMG-box DNA-binding protein 1-like [Haemaphysalis longicornis]
MPPTLKPPRFAHAEGHTEVCYDPTGRYLLTCGADGEVRTWQGFLDDEPKSYTVGEVALALSCGGDKFFVAVDSCCVKVHDTSTGTESGVAARSSSDIYTVACSRDGKTLVAGSGDFNVKVVDVVSGATRELTGHTGPLMCCCLDPRGEFLASSSCDGTVRVWRLADQACVKTWHAVHAKSNDFRTSKVLGRLSWSPSGRKLALPVGAQVRLASRGSWDQADTLAHASVLEDLSLVAFSGCGELLAAASRQGKLFLWDWAAGQLLHTLSCGEGVCSLCWNPSRKELVYCNAQGELAAVEGIEGPARPKTPPPPKVPDWEDDDEDVDLGRIKARYEPLIFNDSDDAEGDPTVAPTTEPAEATVQRSSLPEYRPQLMQEAFQPGSTPIHLQHRFMVWNSVGIVRAHSTAEESSVDVEFHDASVHHTLHRGNPQGHTMAALSSRALLLAAPQQLLCFHFASWDAHKEWSVDVPPTDSIEAVALGGDWLAACCTSGLLRLWSLGGLQRGACRVPGPPIAMCTTPPHSMALFFHQGAGVSSERQFVAVQQYSMSGGRGAHTVEAPIPVPLGDKQRLAWAGYTDEGSLCYVDSDGMVCILSPSGGWLPVCNTRDNVKGQSDHYFVVGVSEYRQQVRALLCKGSRYPPTLPRPVIAILNFSLPYLGMDSEKGRLEEELGRAWCLEEALGAAAQDDQLLAEARSKRQLLLLKLFALAAKAEREFRALDVAGLMDSERLIQGAVEYASKSRRLALAQRVEQLLALRDNDDDDDDDESPPLPAPRQRAAQPERREEPVLKPKPLLLPRSRPVEEARSQVSRPLDEEPTRPAPAPPVARGNPFKVTKTQPSANSVATGRSGATADDSAKPRAGNAPGGGVRQLKLFAAARPGGPAGGKSGVQLYLDSIRAELLQEEAGLTEDQLVSRAVARFKALAAEERAEWNQRAKRRSPSPVRSAKRPRPEVS